MRILITGSSGLIGSALAESLSRLGHEIRPFDLRRRQIEDVRIARSVIEACRDVDGVIHLAAVSRVVWAHRDPLQCAAVNVEGVRNVCSALRLMRPSPWLLFASSREVYGQQNQFPVHESAELRPCNNYAESKVAGEEMVHALRSCGVATAVARFSNVFGHVLDHPDRVVPAFARASAYGGKILVEGPANVFDFTSINDVSRGAVMLVERLRARELLPPIHFTTGRGFALYELEELARVHCEDDLEVETSAPRSYDVSSFYGETTRAREILGWSHTTTIEDGFASLVNAFKSMPKRKLQP